MSDTFSQADRNDGIEPDMVDQNAAPVSQTTGSGVLPMNMIQALNSAIDVKMAEDANVLSFGEDAGYFGGVFRVTDKLQQKHGLTRSFDAPISECGIVAAAIGMGLWPASRRGDPVRRLHLSGLRPDRVGGGQDALPLGRAVHLAADHPQSLSRRHLRRPDA